MVSPNLSLIAELTALQARKGQVNPLADAIERLTNSYAMQERVYRNRVDAQDAQVTR